MIDRYVPMEKFVRVATVAEGTSNTVVFNMEYEPIAMMAQILTVTTGVVKTAGLTVTKAYNGTTKQWDITVGATDIVTGDIVSLIAFA